MIAFGAKTAMLHLNLLQKDEWEWSAHEQPARPNLWARDQRDLLSKSGVILSQPLPLAGMKVLTVTGHRDSISVFDAAQRQSSKLTLQIYDGFKFYNLLWFFFFFFLESWKLRCPLVVWLALQTHSAAHADMYVYMYIYELTLKSSKSEDCIGVK